jgi:hypothetical protein
MFDFSNGGADNYIELWAGVSGSFFSDAGILANASKSWKETYSPTVNMNNVLAMNEKGAVNFLWNPQIMEIGYELNVFNTNDEYSIEFYLENIERVDMVTEALAINLLGNSEIFDLNTMNLDAGDYTVNFNLLDEDNQLVLHAERDINIWPNDISNELEQPFSMATLSNHGIQLRFQNTTNYQIAIYNAAGQLIKSENAFNNSYQVFLPQRGLYIFRVTDSKNNWTRKIIVN